MSHDYQPESIESPPIREEGSPWPRVAVYGARWCRDTVRTRLFLNRHGVPYALMDVEQSAEAAQKVREWNDGILSTPTLDIEGQILTEPSDEELAAVLGIESGEEGAC